MSELLAALRATGEQIEEGAQPLTAELPALFTALVDHLDQHVPELAAIDLSKAPGIIGNPPPEGGGPGNPPPPADDEAAEAADEAAEAAETGELKTRIAELEAQLKAGQAQPPVVSTKPSSEENPPA